MAISTRISISMDDVFPHGAYLVGEITAAEDFERRQAGEQDPQVRDKDSGQRVWHVRVIDADPAARKGQAEVTVKVAADHQPVPPPAVSGVPFRAVAFEGLTVTPYLDENGKRPRLAYSLRATGITAPNSSAKSGRVAAGGESS